MSDDPEEPESKAGEAKPEKKRAEENAWYLLATLYCKPGLLDYELKEKNRVAWNRYFAARLREINEGAVARLIEETHGPSFLRMFNSMNLLILKDLLSHTAHLRARLVPSRFVLELRLARSPA